MYLEIYTPIRKRVSEIETTERIGKKNNKIGKLI